MYRTDPGSLDGGHATDTAALATRNDAAHCADVESSLLPGERLSREWFNAQLDGIRLEIFFGEPSAQQVRDTWFVEDRSETTLQYVDDEADQGLELTSWTVRGLPNNVVHESLGRFEGGVPTRTTETLVFSAGGDPEERLTTVGRSWSRDRFGYDGPRRILWEEHDDDDDGTVDRRVERTYGDRRHTQTWWTDGIVVSYVEIDLDGAGQPIEQRVAPAEGESWVQVTTYTYEGGRLVETKEVWVSSGEARTTSQAYDAQGRLVQLAFDGYRQEVLDYTYVPCPPRPPQVTPTGG